MKKTILHKHWYEVRPTKEICGVGSKIALTLKEARHEAAVIRKYCRPQILKFTQEEIK